MKKMPVNSRFSKLFLRFSLLFALLVIGGGGIFSEENNIPSHLWYPSNNFYKTYFTKLRFNSGAFVPKMLYVEGYSSSSKHPMVKLSVKEPGIMGMGKSSRSMLTEFLEKNNPAISVRKASEIVSIYIQEADKEGVNYDVAFSQMCLETGFLRYGGNVKPRQNNFCGLGVSSNDSHGLSFPSIRIGIRAHIQHLKAYATTARIKNPIVDSRLRFVKRGSVKTIGELSGKWASDKHYSTKILSLMTRLYEERHD